ncbi:ABC transporter ATP-binding protein [Xylanimonas ulmi]|uniref:ABC-type multidrug transport system fused ATPase/permease subunit n=1 Tax=Xylanimonas ulmi TaxID=228973 RepID=A0A4Q7M5F0_9MICO|nr:ABC transporter ATP-binding protein [Xylanibacterium ulmi]RZS63215.1 ABC-type multidrug transport system fused ATPase/permease subunit [Xylanibacterium ulmi]
MRPLPLSDPGAPPLRGPWSFLGWLARRQAATLAAALTCGVITFGAQAVQPFLLGRVVDSALDGGLDAATWRWAGALLAVGVAMAAVSVVGHRFDIRNWMHAAFRSSQLVSRTVSRSGHAVSAELPTGEVVAAVANDTFRIGELFAMSAQFLGSLVAYAVTTALMLSASVRLGLVVAAGLPVVAIVLAFLVKPLSRRQAAQREATGRLTTLGADTVSGLRILRGIGGEGVFAARYRAQSQAVRAAGVRVAGTQSWLDALQVLLPGLFVVVVVYLGALAAVDGHITAGQLVSFYGYAAFLGWPVQLATQYLKIATNAHVSAAKVVKVLRVVPATGAAPATATPPAPGAVLRDETTGVELTPGRVLALVAADPDEAAAVAVRLGRFDDAAEAGTPVTLGGTPLASLPKEHLRQRIVVAEATPTIFSGRLGAELDARSRAGLADLERAVHVADAHDVLDSVPDGLAGDLPEKGRSLSGGQRQRVALARALLTDPEILVLVEPTSAVDAHTEARIAARLADARRGRTTLIVTASPLVLDHVDEVLFLDGGRVAVRGAHRDLLNHAGAAEGGQAAARYRAVVGRTLRDENGQNGARQNETRHDETAEARS